jgi:hypothetical protein
MNGPVFISFGQINNILRIGFTVGLFNESLLDLNFNFFISLFGIYPCIFQGIWSNHTDIEMRDEDAGYKKFSAVLALQTGCIFDTSLILFELLLLLLGLFCSLLHVFQSRG